MYMPKVDNHPLGENSPNLVTLPAWARKFLKHKPVKTFFLLSAELGCRKLDFCDL
jgi:hypothetical protein